MGETRSEAMQEITEAQEESYKSGSVQYIDSREVAEMVGKAHHKLLRDIRNYINHLNQSEIGCVDFFAEASYQDAKGEKRPCYLVTQKGCEFIAHKLTGEKGSIFTATYINRFHEMEDKLAEREYEKRFQQLMERQDKFEQMILEQLNDMQIRRNMDIMPKSFSACVEDESESVKRIKELNKLITKMARACGWEKRFAFHRLYKTLEYVLDISLDDYLEIHQVETGNMNISTLEMLVEYNRLYETAVRLCTNTINSMKC